MVCNGVVARPPRTWVANATLETEQWYLPGEGGATDTSPAIRPDIKNNGLIVGVSGG